MPRLRGDKSDSHHHDAPPEIHGTGPSGSHGINRICKRSFKGAQQRLALHGFAYYHGRLITGLPSNRHEQTPSYVTPSRPGKTRKHLAICCWNAMALSSEGFVELLQWASVRQIAALMIQSTHWSIEEPWTSYGYHIIPSPELYKAGGGLITAIRASICAIHGISYQDWLPGRLLHVRCHLNKHQLDLVNIYQVPMQKTLTRPEPLKKRLDIWNSVHRLLHQLPVRNTLVLGGDFNTSTQARTGVAASDVHMFRNLLKDYGLTNLRTSENTPLRPQTTSS